MEINQMEDIRSNLVLYIRLSWPHFITNKIIKCQIVYFLIIVIVKILNNFFVYLNK